MKDIYTNSSKTVHLHKERNKINRCQQDTQIKNVESYIYLRQRFSARDKTQDKEIQRRITAGWAALPKHRDIFKGNIGTCLKRIVYNSTVFPAMSYGAKNTSTHHLSKEQASSRTNKDGKEYVKHQIRDNRWTLRITTRKRKDLEKGRRDGGETNWTTTGRVPSGRG